MPFHRWVTEWEQRVTLMCDLEGGGGGWWGGVGGVGWVGLRGICETEPPTPPCMLICHLSHWWWRSNLAEGHVSADPVLSLWLFDGEAGIDYAKADYLKPIHANPTHFSQMLTGTGEYMSWKAIVLVDNCEWWDKLSERHVNCCIGCSVICVSVGIRVWTVGWVNRYFWIITGNLISNNWRESYNIFRGVRQGYYIIYNFPPKWW